MSVGSPLEQMKSQSLAVALLRKLFSFPVAMAGALSILVVLTVRGRFADLDMWWDLRTGQVIWNTHHIPTIDLFSYTTNHHAWVPHEWLAQVVMYGTYLLGGYSGLMVWLCVFTAALTITGFAVCSLYSGNVKVGFLGGLLVWFFATMIFTIRPQVIGYWLMEVELLLLWLGHRRSPRWFYVLPVLFMVWVNCHASFFFGLIILGVYLGCSFFKFEIGSLATDPWSVEERKALAITTGLSVVAVFLNPVGIRQVLYPLDTVFKQHLVVTAISEWRPLPLNDPRGAGLLGILAFLFLYLITRTTARIYLHEVALIALGTWMGFSHKRLVVVFGIMVAPVVTRLLAKAWENYDPEKDRPVANAVLIALALLVIVKAFPSNEDLHLQVERMSPVHAVEYIKSHHLSGNMINNFGDGGYLIWALPEHPVFIDGRADIYEWSGVMGKFFRWETVGDNPNTLLDQYHVNFCLLHRWTPVVNALRLLPNWKQVYEGKRSVIFVRTSGAAPSK